MRFDDKNGGSFGKEEEVLYESQSVCNKDNHSN